MIDPTKLLVDLKRWVTRLEDDLRARCREHAEVDAHFRASYTAARAARRTAHPYETWREEELTQVAVGWLLATVFVRFLEDNRLLDAPWLSGPGDWRAHAGAVREAYFRKFPSHSDNDYLRHVFEQVGRLPGLGDLFDPRHNPLWEAKISGDAAAALLEFWRRIDGATGALVHDFTDPEWGTRFLGDLYQNLSEEAQKRFALLQTPEFVEEFILDRTLDPALQVFGYKVVRMIDPACGSGHFLLGGYRRLLRHWRAGDPSLSPKEVARLALEAIHGVDLNPFAVAIARFRLLLEAWRHAGVRRLKEAPAFVVKLAVGDSLLHAPNFSREGEAIAVGRQLEFHTGPDFRDTLRHYYETEDGDLLRRILGQQYHAVVANPPYITVKDKALNELYRTRYGSCHRKYSLAAPFLELIFALALEGDPRERRPAGYTGQITANSFMKREFGKKLIEDYLPRWDLTHVLDTSGCYIPGHGTPTVILFGRHQRPFSPTIRTVLGIQGEPATPEDPARGLVWSALLDQVDRPGSQSDFLSAADSQREKFHQHPWSIGGGGAAELKDVIQHCSNQFMERFVIEIGITSVTGEDDLYLWPNAASFLRSRNEHSKLVLIGEMIRDWTSLDGFTSTWLYDSDYCLLPIFKLTRTFQQFWNYRSSISHRRRFGTPMLERGLTWYEWQELYESKLQTPLSITFASIATHNHFVLDRGGKVFKQSAPVIKLPDGASENDHLQLLGLLNSSTACFWMKQVAHGKTKGDGGTAHATPEYQRFDFDGTKLRQFPVPEGRPLALAARLDALARAGSGQAPAVILNQWARAGGPLAEVLAAAAATAAGLRGRMIALQEELDWQCYRLYGQTEAADDLEWPEGRLDELPELSLGERAFEIRLARQMAAGEVETTWFERHREAGSRPRTDLPVGWTAAYADLVRRRLAAIRDFPNINLIERPEYKRRWNTEPWASRQENALRQWLLTRLEAYFHDADRMVDEADETARRALLERLKPSRQAFPAGQAPVLGSTRQLADAAQLDAQWMEAAQVYTGHPAFDVPKLVRELVEDESVPFLPRLRYKESGLRHRVQWERTWELQRLEDAVEARVRREHPGSPEERLQPLIQAARQREIGDIPVPPKYRSADFRKTTFWSLRGKLDVPKERWISFPGAERPGDPSPVIAWAGWDHQRRIQALGAWYHDRQSLDGWDAARLRPLLAGMKDLLPWVRQWHPGIHPEFGQNLASFFEGFLRDQSHELGLTDADLEKERVGD